MFILKYLLRYNDIYFSDVVYILTWKYASRHNGVYFFDILIAKSDQELICFADFKLEICFVL